MGKKLVGFLWLGIWTISPLIAQSQSNTADLSGQVMDQTGAILPGADISAVNTETGLTRTSFSNDEGRYRVPLLPPGTYDVRAELPGFSTKVFSSVTLTVGQYANLDITLDLSPTQIEIVVSGNANIVEREKTVQASTVEEVQIDNLPINGRNYLDFSLLTPGVTNDNSMLTYSSPATPTSGLSFAGQDQRSNYVTIDGADNIDIISNTVRSTLSQEAIQEFQISRNTFSAEFGRSRGGMLNIVSKSGTNAYHGNAFFFFRDDSLDARNTFAQGDPPFERYEFGGTVGGPIVKDRTFFFTSYERLDRQESLFVTFLDDPTIFQPTSSQNELFGFLGSTGLPGMEILAAAFINPNFGVLHTLESNFPETLTLLERESGTFPFEADQDVFSFKLDHQFSAQNSFFARFNLGDSFNDGVQFGALQGVSNGVSFDTRDLAVVAADTHIFSPNTLNEIKFQISDREFAVATNDPVGPEISIAGVAQLGQEFFNPTAYEQTLVQVADNLTFIRGKHTFKGGVDYTLMDLKGFAEVFLGGQFTFAEAIPLGSVMDSLLGRGTALGLITQLSTPAEAGGFGRPDLAGNVLDPLSSVQSFNFGLPITYFQGFGDPTADLVYNQLAFYFQDNWGISDNFTLNLGLRYDVDWRADTLNVVSLAPPQFQFDFFATKDHNNWAPRLGFAWDLSGEGRTVVRGGYGIYYQSFFQATAFVSQVLSGQISQVFLPITGLPGLGATSADVWEAFQESGRLDAATLNSVGIDPSSELTPSIILPSDTDVVNPYSQHASLGIEQQLGRNWALALDYLLNRGVKLIRGRDINVLQRGPNQFGLPGLDPRFVQVDIIETSGSSIYHGFTAALRKRFEDNYGLSVSYTLGKAIDDVTDFITQYHPNNQKDLASERSLSSFDQRHRFVISAIVQSGVQMSGGNNFLENLIADWTVAPIITWSSGRPFNLLTGFDLNGDTHEETDRPVLSSGVIAGRNTGKGPNFFGTNLRLSRKFRLPREEMNFEFIFEAFNLFNNVSYSGVNNVVGTTLLDSAHVGGSKRIPANQPLGFTAAFDPRQIQFGFRFNF